MMTSEEKKDLAEAICGLVLLIGLPLWYLWSGYVDVRLWNWFAVPLGAPSITIIQAIGLGLIVRSHTYVVPRKNTKSSKILAAAIIVPGFSLFIGWLVHQGMS